MQEKRPSRKSGAATRARRVSLDLTDDSQSEALERKMLEAIERIERLRSKTRLIGAMLAAR